MLSFKLLNKDVKNFVRKQLKQQRNQEPRGLGSRIFQSGKPRMLKKLADSKLDEKKLRKERDPLRNKLEDQVSQNVYMRIMRKMKSKVDRIRQSIKKKNKQIFVFSLSLHSS